MNINRKKYTTMRIKLKIDGIKLAVVLMLATVLSITGSYRNVAAAPLEDCDLDGFDDTTGVPVPWPGYDETKGDTPDGPGGGSGSGTASSGAGASATGNTANTGTTVTESSKSSGSSSGTVTGATNSTAGQTSGQSTGSTGNKSSDSNTAEDISDSASGNSSNTSNTSSQTSTGNNNASSAGTSNTSSTSGSSSASSDNKGNVTTGTTATSTTGASASTKDGALGSVANTTSGTGATGNTGSATKDSTVTSNKSNVGSNTVGNNTTVNNTTGNNTTGNNTAGNNTTGTDASSNYVSGNGAAASYENTASVNISSSDSANANNTVNSNGVSGAAVGNSESFAGNSENLTSDADLFESDIQNNPEEFTQDDVRQATFNSNTENTDNLILSEEEIEAVINTKGTLAITDVSGSLVHAGSTVIINGYGFQGNINSLELVIESEPRLLINVPSAEDGSFVTEVKIPEDLAAGSHHIVVLYQGMEIMRQQLEIGPKTADSFIQALFVGFTKDNKGLLPGLTILGGLLVIGFVILVINVLSQARGKQLLKVVPASRVDHFKP